MTTAKDEFAVPSTSASQLEESFLNLLKKNPKGVVDVDIQIGMPDLTAQQRVQLINSLLAKGQLDLFNQGTKLVYKYKEKTVAQVGKGADNEEKVVMRIIEEASNKGIWMRDIRFQSNLMPTQLNKILKALENKKLIKAVKSVSASKKKVYMLFNLEPDKSLTGGAWYSDQDFEAEFVGILSQQCFRFLLEKQRKAADSGVGPRETRNMAYATSTEVWKFISELGISKVQLSVEDIETILDTIVYDGKVDKFVCVDLSKRYRAIEPLLPPPGIVQIPCGVCPIRCASMGFIGPPDPVSNLRKYKFVVPPNPTPLEKRLHEEQESVHKWNEEFWTSHNTEFTSKRELFIKNELSKKDDKTATLNADEMSVFYKQFLDENWIRHVTYNFSWYKKNVALTSLYLKVKLSQLLQSK